MMRLGAELLGFRLPVVATVINGSNSGSWRWLALRSAFDALHLRLMLITSPLRVTVAPTPSTTCRRFATSATH